VSQRFGDETIRGFSGPGGDPLLGTVVENYRFESVVGTGSMGIVYRAIHTLIGKPAAIKVLKRDFAGDPEMVRRLVREARTVNSIRHPSIVNAFGFGTLPRTGQPYIVMDLLIGEPLDAFIKREAPVSLRTATGILDELLAGLYAAHQVGVVHRDMKPGNCFLEQQMDAFRLKLLDFGLARQADRAGGSIRPTNPGTLVGTPAFMAPEQVLGQKVTPATDLYAVGGIAYQLLTGHLPHEAASAIEVLTQKMKQEPVRPRQWNPRLDDDVEAWILSLLTRDPEQRPRDADAVRRALRRLSEARTMSAAPAHGSTGPSKRASPTRRPMGDAQTILVDSASGSEASTDAHNSPWAKTVAVGTPGPERTPPANESSRHSTNPPEAATAVLLPATEVDASYQLPPHRLPPTVPSGTPGVSRRQFPAVTPKPPQEPEEHITAPRPMATLMRWPVALWIAIGVLAAAAGAVAIWLSLRAS
jgi:serine/threonine protein kinase